MNPARSQRKSLRGRRWRVQGFWTDWKEEEEITGLFLDFKENQRKTASNQGFKSNLRIKPGKNHRLTSFFHSRTTTNPNRCKSVRNSKSFGSESWNPKIFQKTFEIPRFTTCINRCKPTNPRTKTFRKRFEPKTEPKPFEIHERELKIYIVSVNACEFQ